MALAGRFLCATVAVTTMAACTATRVGPSTPRGAPQSGGTSIYVFVHGASAAQGAINQEISEAWAKREDGGLVPLQISGVPPGQATSPPERLWLSGWVSPGAYSGFELALRPPAGAEPGRMEAPHVPEAPTGLAFPFVVAPETGLVLSAELRPPAQSGGAGNLIPDVILSKPPRIASGLLGLASVDGWDAVALFDKRTGRVASVVPVGRAPEGLAIDAERLRAYVAVAGDDTVAVLDLLEERVRERVTLRGGDAPLDAALTPDGRMLLVANSGSDTVSFVDTVAAVEVERLAVGGRPVSIVMASDGRRAFVVAERASSVTVVDVSSRSVIGSIATETGPVRARLGGRSGELLYVVHGSSPYLVVADTGSLTAVRRVYVGNGARALEVEPRGGRIYIARSKTRKIEVFDPGSLLPIDEIDVSGDVAYLTLETEGNGLGVLLDDSCEADIVGIVGRKILTRTALGPDARALQFVETR